MCRKGGPVEAPRSLLRSCKAATNLGGLVSDANRISKPPLPPSKTQQFFVASPRGLGAAPKYQVFSPTQTNSQPGLYFSRKNPDQKIRSDQRDQRDRLSKKKIRSDQRDQRDRSLQKWMGSTGSTGSRRSEFGKKDQCDPVDQS